MIYALKMDFTSVLSKLHEDVVITKGVHDEVVTRGKRKGKAEAYICEKLIKTGNIIVHDSPSTSPILGLGPGETETIQNAIEHKCACIIDDKKGRRVAVSMNLDSRSIGLELLAALKKKIISSGEFDVFYSKWTKYALPSPEDINFVRQVKVLVE
jgi:predicted nucleic acid-binding protein